MDWANPWKCQSLPCNTRQGALTSTEHCGVQQQISRLGRLFCTHPRKKNINMNVIGDRYSRNAEDIRHSRITAKSACRLSGVAGCKHLNRWNHFRHCTQVTLVACGSTSPPRHRTSPEGELLEVTTAARAVMYPTGWWKGAAPPWMPNCWILFTEKFLGSWLLDDERVGPKKWRVLNDDHVC